MQYIYVISVFTENTLRVLQRLASIFARYRLNVEQLNVFETSNKGVSYFNIVVHSDAKKIQRVIHQLQRIVELLEVKITNQVPLHEPTTTAEIMPPNCSGTYLQQH